MDNRPLISESIRPLAVEIASLVPDPRNARKHGKRNLDAIAASLAKFGQQKPIVVAADGTVLAGNGTLDAAKSLGWEWLAASRTSLVGGDAVAFALADNRTAELAEWEDAILADILREIPSTLVVGFDQAEIDDLLSGGDGGKYTVKVASPIYEPRGDRPKVSELFDRSKTVQLLAKIGRDVPDEVAGFLRVAAERHTVFDYAKIAEFYAHADENVRALFEDSGLVIIDFDGAIERGFVVLTEKIRALAEREESEDA